MGDRVSRPERRAVRARRAPVAGDPRRAVGGALDRGAPRLRRTRDGRRRARSFCLGGRRRLHAADDACRREPAVEGRRRPLLVGHARGRVPRRGAGAPADDGRGRSLPQPRPDRLPHLRRDPRHARRPGPDAAGPDPLARSRGRPTRGEGGDEGADPGRGGRTRAAGRAGRRGLGEPGHGRAAARPLRLPPGPVPVAVRPGERRRDRRTNRSATSGCAASSSRPSGRSCAGSGWKAASTTTSCAGCSATSISRTSASTSRPRASSPAAA